jgi:hypothetical protein
MDRGSWLSGISLAYSSSTDLSCISTCTRIWNMLCGPRIWSPSHPIKVHGY